MSKPTENRNHNANQPEATSTNPPLLSNTSQQDSCNKLIFRNATLCAQFIRDYMDIPLLKNVQPEDIENVTSRFVHLFSEDRDSDTINRIHIRGHAPFFLVSLLEHKTYVDYNVAMQILRYMVYIWEDYEKESRQLHDEWEQKRKQGRNQGRNPHKISSQKDFAYPVILPIVYYEGAANWKAPLHLKERIWMHEGFAPYIPDFRYELIQLKDYSNELLLSHADEISVIMLFNKLQSAEDVAKLTEIPKEQIHAIIEQTPEYLLDIISQVIRAFLLHINLPLAETEDIVDNVKERKMGYLFENAEKMDIQMERRLRKAAQAAVVERDNIIAEKDNALAEKDNTIAMLKKEIAALKKQ